MDNSTDTAVLADNVATVTTDTDSRFESDEKSSETTAAKKSPKVETKEVRHILTTQVLYP